MPLAIDGSSPPDVVTDLFAGTVTTASFTAPASALLVAFADMANTGGSTVGPTVSDSSTLTWTQAGTIGPSPGSDQSIVWWALAPLSTARTVSVSGSIDNGQNKYLQVIVFTGSDQVNPIGNITTGSGTGVASASVTSSRTGSWLWMAYADKDNGSVPTADTGSTLYSGAQVGAFGTTGATIYQTATGSSGTTMTAASSAPSGNRTSWVAVEILPVAMPVAAIRVVRQAVPRAATR